MEETIRLFKALPIKSKRKKNPTRALLEKTIPRGFTFSPEVVANYSNYDELIKMVEEEIGLAPGKLNNSFHKSWEKIKTASIEQLIFEQIIHYMTTYGAEEWGVFKEDNVFIPAEKLEIPELGVGLKLTVIKGYTKVELKEKLLNMLKSGIALKEETIEDVMVVAKFVGLGGKEIDLIKNKEVRVRLYEDLKEIPENPTEFLRYLVYISTDTGLLIKNGYLISKIKEESNSCSTNLLNDYDRKYGLERLSEIFYRFKPIFLAFKEVFANKPIINKIRKKAIKFHKPMPEDYLNNVTATLKKNKKLDSTKLKKELEKANVFRKIRLAYALNFRTKDADSILYRVRSGRAFADDFSFSNKAGAKAALDVVVKSIVEDVKKNVDGKKIYIPSKMGYALPATEKQFTGDFPSGTYVSVPKDMIVGVHWGQETGSRVDLDLSMINVDGKLGWDSGYRSEGRDMLFSGDMTSAPKPNGATELFYFKRQPSKPSLMMVNYYNFSEDDDCLFKIIVAEEETKNLKLNYMVNPNNLKAVAKTHIDKRQAILGLVIPQTNGCRFYFAEASVGNSISSSSNDDATKIRKYLFNFYKNAIELKDILKKAGAVLVEDNKDCDIDLSPETLERDSILNLLVSK